MFRDKLSAVYLLRRVCQPVVGKRSFISHQNTLGSVVYGPVLIRNGVQESGGMWYSQMSPNSISGGQMELSGVGGGLMRHLRKGI